VRIARFVAPTGLSWGVVESDEVAAIDGHPFAAITFTGVRWPLAEVRMLSPILPSKVVAVGLQPHSSQVEHEAELAVVIGLPAKDVQREKAFDHVLGYTAANDVTARDQQRADVQFTRAKGYDSFCPIGPWIETVLDPSDLRITATVNGEIRQDGRTSQMVHDVAALIAFASNVMTLLPGDVILTGTPGGVGPLRDGDRVSIEIEGIGTLTNEVRAK